MPEEKYHLGSFLRLMNYLERYPIQYKDEEQKKIAEAGISTIETKPLQIKVEAPDTKRLEPWKPPKPLKQRILEDDRPQAELYKKLIKAWPDISDSKLAEVIQEVPRERIEKLLYVYDSSGRLFEEFLDPHLTYQQILLLDRISLYYRLLDEAGRLGLLDNLEEGLEHKITIDNKQYKAMLFAFLDGKRASLNFYPDQFDRPRLGIPYHDWPCLEKFKEAVRRKAENLAASLKELNINSDDLMNLKNEIEHIKELENSFLPLGIETFITFPVKYAVKDGVFGAHLYVNRIILTCGLCGRQHSLWLIAKVR